MLLPVAGTCAGANALDWLNQARFLHPSASDAAAHASEAVQDLLQAPPQVTP